MDNSVSYVDTFMEFSKSAGGNVQVDRIALTPGALLPCQGYPEERLYYVQSGHGAVSVYGEIDKGDTYVLRPDVTVYFTPGLIHQIVNLSDITMNLVVFRVTGGLIPERAEEGVQRWTSIGRSNDVGTGFWYTDIFNLRENETVREGQYLQIWGVGMRRPQKIYGGEVLSLWAGRSTRQHAHTEANETFYILMGQGEFVVDGERVPFKAGTAYSVPMGVAHHLVNTGNAPVLYICITTGV